MCSGGTGHAEVVQVEFDPQVVSFAELLEVFWGCHDPTQVDRQGVDVGSQYRSAIFFHSPEQGVEARRIIDELNGSGRFGAPVATQVAAATEFYPAEDYHQRYVERRGMGSCRF